MWGSPVHFPQNMLELIAGMQAQERVASRNLRHSVCPTREEREEYLSIQEAVARFRTMIKLTPDELEYRPIPKCIIEKLPGGIAWIGPTPKPVQMVIEAISICWREYKQFGFILGLKVPKGMTDDQIEKVIEALNNELAAEYRAWGKKAGFEGPPHFPDDLSIESKRTVVARIQEAIHASGVKDKTVDNERERN